MEKTEQLLEYEKDFSEDKGVCYRCLRVLPYELLEYREYYIFKQLVEVYICKKCKYYDHVGQNL